MVECGLKPHTLGVFYIALVTCRWCGSSWTVQALQHFSFRSWAPGLVAGTQSFPEWMTREVWILRRSLGRPGRNSLYFLHYSCSQSEGKSGTFSHSIPRKLREQRGAIEQELEKVFSASVSADVDEAAAAPLSLELVATIVLGVLLAATCIAFLAYVLLDLRRKRYRHLALAMWFRFTTDGFNEGSTRTMSVW